MGRPKIDNPKNKEIKIRISQADINKLEICSISLNTTKSEIIRNGIDKIYQELENK